MKRPELLICMLAFLFPSPAQATGEAPSLFFMADELLRIERGTEPVPPPAPDELFVRLESLIYFGPGRWTLWLQGRKWTPDTRDAEIEILSVAPEKVKLRIDLPSAGGKRELTLRPHQTYHVTKNKITESYAESKTGQAPSGAAF